jgi:hypothetical protein
MQDFGYQEPAIGEAADGRVRVELDDDGRLYDLYLDPRVAYLPVEELREALFDAFTGAQDRLRDRSDVAAATRYAGTAAPERLQAALTEASETAERRFAEVSTALFDLSRRAGRSW